MRYRHSEQAFFSGGKLWHEGLSGFGDGVDGDQELSHGGDESELGGLSLGAQAVVEGFEPRVSADGGKGWHPQGGAQAGVADGGDPGAGGPLSVRDCQELRGPFALARGLKRFELPPIAQRHHPARRRRTGIVRAVRARLAVTLQPQSPTRRGHSDSSLGLFPHTTVVLP